MTSERYFSIKRCLQSQKGALKRHDVVFDKNRLDRPSALHQLITWSQRVCNASSEHLKGWWHFMGVGFVLALLLGIGSGVGLLSYNGDTPVNLLYFLTFSLFIPLLSLFFSLVSLLLVLRGRSPLKGAFFMGWLSPLLEMFPWIEKQRKAYPLPPFVQRWFFLMLSQKGAWFFSLGLWIALLWIVFSRDIAFVWSSTLSIEPEVLHRLFSLIASPWSWWFPEGVPSLELIQKSHYFRLGGEVSEAMVSEASQLGAWWKFLAMSTLFYALFLRLILLLVTHWGYSKALEEALLSDPQVEALFVEPYRPSVQTQAIEKEKVSPQLSQPYDLNAIVVDTPKTQSRLFRRLYAWEIEKEEAEHIAKRLSLEAMGYESVGGMHSLEAEEALLEDVSGEVCFLVKGWEPPTMECMDFLEGLTQRATRVVLAPVGTPSEGYKASQREEEIWKRKVLFLSLDSVEWYQ